MTTKRLVWVDQLKAIGMFFVIWGHCIQRTSAKLIFKGIYSFHIPFFFILSGLTFNPDKYKRIKDFIISKAKSILYPYLIMSFVMLPIWYFNRSIGAVQNDRILKILFGIFYSNSAEIRAPINAAWFMVTLFFAEFIFYLLYRFFKEDKEMFIVSFSLSLLGVIASLGTEVRDAPFHFDVACVAQFYVCLGYIIKRNLDYIIGTIKEFGEIKGVSIIFMVAIFFAYINKTVDFSNEKYGNYLYVLISSIGISIVLIYLFRKLPSMSLLNYIGKNTMIYLIMHIPILRMFQQFFPVIENDPFVASLTALGLYILILPICFIINNYLPFLIRFPKNRMKMEGKV